LAPYLKLISWMDRSSTSTVFPSRYLRSWSDSVGVSATASPRTDATLICLPWAEPSTRFRYNIADNGWHPCRVIAPPPVYLHLDACGACEPLCDSSPRMSSTFASVLSSSSRLRCTLGAYT